MTVQELIDRLQNITDKTKKVYRPHSDIYVEEIQVVEEGDFDYYNFTQREISYEGQDDKIVWIE